MFSILLAFSAASVAQQMAPAKQGMQQCQMPNAAAKTCFSLSRVRQTSPSTYAFDSEILVDEAGTITATIHSTVFVRGGAICEVMKRSDLDQATIASEGNRQGRAQSAEYRARLEADYAPVFGHTICTQIVADEDGSLTVIGTLDGRRIPAGDYPMLWVKPEDGWKVAP